MIRISLPYVWSLCEQMETIAKADPSKAWTKIDLALELIPAEVGLETLLQSSVFANTLRSSRELGYSLLQQMQTEIRYNDQSKSNERTYALPSIQYAYGQFRTAFLAELGTFPAYFVSQKGSHDTLTLLDQSWRLFPDDLVKKVPEAMYDVGEAGKALCYETATACGFHLFRATEAILRRYYTHVSGGKAPPKVRNIMVYVNGMRQAKCGEERILSVIEQLSKLHRNPIAHPEVALTLDEAISILGMARSAVTAMLSALPMLPQTTAVAPTGKV